MEEIERILLEIEQRKEQNKNLAKSLLEKDFSGKALEEKLKIPIEKIAISGKICAVDSGLYAQSMHGADIVATRTAAVCFEYTKGELKKVNYLPSRRPLTRFSARSGLDEHETNQFKTLHRLNEELEMTVKCLETFKPDAILMDGSLLPLLSDRPTEGSAIENYYLQVITRYKELFSLANKNNCLLTGVIKDSRGKRFAEIAGVKEICDTYLLDFILQEGERTFAMAYAGEKKSQIINDIGKEAEKVKVVYLKAGERDRPLRIEFLSEKIDGVASLVYSLSAINRNYAYPAPLIEVDLCAAMDLKDVEQIQRRLSNKGLQPLRRNSRPFR